MNIRKGNGSSTVLNIRGDDIRKGNGSTILFNIRGNDIREGNGSTILYNCTGRLNTKELAAVLHALGEI